MMNSLQSKIQKLIILLKFTLTFLPELITCVFKDKVYGTNIDCNIKYLVEGVLTNGVFICFNHIYAESFAD